MYYKIKGKFPPSKNIDLKINFNFIKSNIAELSFCNCTVRGVFYKELQSAYICLVLSWATSFFMNIKKINIVKKSFRQNALLERHWLVGIQGSRQPKCQISPTILLRRKATMLLYNGPGWFRKYVGRWGINRENFNSYDVMLSYPTNSALLINFRLSSDAETLLTSTD